MNKRLQLKFENEDKEAFSISMKDYKADISAEEVKEASSKILASNALAHKGKKVTGLVEANVITITTEKLV